MFEQLEKTLNEIKRDADGACYKSSKAVTALESLKEWRVVHCIILMLMIFFLAHAWMSVRSLKEELATTNEKLQDIRVYQGQILELQQNKK